MLFLIKRVINVINNLKLQLRHNFNNQKTVNKYQYGKIYKSDDGKCLLQEVEQNYRSDIIAIYKITHEDGLGSITVKLHDINKYKVKTKDKLLNKAEEGNLERAESLIKRYKNMNTNKYTHRLYILNKKNHEYKTYSIIDLKLNTFNNEYNNYFTKKIFFTFLKNLINKSYKTDYTDVIMQLLKEPWHQEIIKLTKEFYKKQNYSINNLDSKIIYCRLNNYE